MNIKPWDLIGLVLPPVIDLINSNVANPKAKYIISIIISVIVGVIVNYNKFNDWQSLLGNIAIVFASAQTVHKLYWSTSKLGLKMA